MCRICCYDDFLIYSYLFQFLKLYIHICTFFEGRENIVKLLEAAAAREKLKQGKELQTRGLNVLLQEGYFFILSSI